jgi:hypothetical protein
VDNQIRHNHHQRAMMNCFYRQTRRACSVQKQVNCKRKLGPTKIISGIVSSTQSVSTHACMYVCMYVCRLPFGKEIFTYEYMTRQYHVFNLLQMGDAYLMTLFIISTSCEACHPKVSRHKSLSFFYHNLIS